MSGEGALYTFSLCTMALGTSTFTSNGGGTCAFEDKGMSEGVELRGYFLDYGENKIDDNSCIFK